VHKLSKTKNKTAIKMIIDKQYQKLTSSKTCESIASLSSTVFTF